MKEEENTWAAAKSDDETIVTVTLALTFSLSLSPVSYLAAVKHFLFLSLPRISPSSVSVVADEDHLIPAQPRHSVNNSNTSSLPRWPPPQLSFPSALSSCQMGKQFGGDEDSSSTISITSTANSVITGRITTLLFHHHQQLSIRTQAGQNKR